MSITPVSPLNLERYELKYRIPANMVEPISDYVSQYCDMDFYSQISPDGFYLINSLYLDTPSFYILRRQETAEFDYSCFRIRSYGDRPKPPYYFESKQKMRDFCKKRRAKVPIENFADLFENPDAVTGFKPYGDKNLVDFLEKAQTFGLQPKILTQYRRRAFLSRHDDYARVTFDRDMRYCEESTYNIHPDESRMTHYDHPETFMDFGSGRNVVLELKCERKIPMWMISLIRCFQLSHDRFSKYQSASIECYGRRNHLELRDLVASRPSRGLFRGA